MNCARNVPKLGVDVPLAGPDGGQGILALQAVRLALSEDAKDALLLDVRDASGGGFANPHEDEGAGDWRNARYAAKNMASLGADRSVIGVVGGFNDAVARAELRAADRAKVPLVLANHVPNDAMRELPSSFDKAYRQRYGEAPDASAERYYIATKMILNCSARSREELARCLRKAGWNGTVRSF